MTNYEDLDAQSEQYNSDFPYSLDNDLMINWYVDRIIGLNHKAGSPGSALELGIGFGFSTVKLGNHFGSYTVVDGSKAAIEKFKATHDAHRIEFVHSFFEEFSTDERYDAVIMGFVLEHVDDDELVLRRFTRFLKPNGRLYIVVPNSESLNRRIGHEAGLLDDMNALSESDIAVGHRRLYSVEGLKGLVSTCGLKLSRLEGLFLKPITTAQIHKLEFSDEILKAMMVVGKDYPELCSGLFAECVPDSSE